MRRKLMLRLAPIRKLRGLSQERLAKKVGVSREYIARLEVGLHDPPLSTLVTLAAALNTGVNQLLKFSRRGGYTMAAERDKEKQWNQSVQERIDTIRKTITWMKQEQTYAEEHKDWYTERGLAKAQHLLEQAVVELRDMQYFDDPTSVNNWRKSQCVDT